MTFGGYSAAIIQMKLHSDLRASAIECCGVGSESEVERWTSTFINPDFLWLSTLQVIFSSSDNTIRSREPGNIQIAVHETRQGELVVYLRFWGWYIGKLSISEDPGRPVASRFADPFGGNFLLLPIFSWNDLILRNCLNICTRCNGNYWRRRPLVYINNFVMTWLVI